MNPEQVARIVELRWNSDGRCMTCRSHASLASYGPLVEAVRVNKRDSAFQLRCLSEGGETHLGVRIRFSGS